MRFSPSGEVHATDGEERALCLAIRGFRTAAEQEELRTLVEGFGLDLLASVAAEHRVKALAGVGLLAAGFVLAEEWMAEVSRNRVRVATMVEALTQIMPRLEDEGIKSAAVEAGGVLLSTNLPLEGFCPGDIDLLVSSNDWVLVRSVLEGCGFVLECERSLASGRLAFLKRQSAGAVIHLEVCHKLFERRWLPVGFGDLSQEWLSGRVASVKDPRLSTLAPAQALAAVAIHASLHLFVRDPGLRLYVDIDRLTRDQIIDWDSFAEVVIKSQATRRVSVALAMAAGLLRAPIPEHVLKRLAPGSRVKQAIMEQLSRKGRLRDQSKLGRYQQIRLEMLLEDRGVMTWAQDAILPPERWMRDRFGNDGTEDSLLTLHARRVRGLLRL